MDLLVCVFLFSYFLAFFYKFPPQMSEGCTEGKLSYDVFLMSGSGRGSVQVHR